MSKRALAVFTSLLLSVAGLNLTSAKNNVENSHENSVKPVPASLLNSSVQQLVLVVSEDWEADVASMYRYQKHQGQWQLVGDTTAVNLGRTGLAWGIGLHPKQTGYYKKEGDGKAPAGIFEFGTAFGYLPTVTTDMPYSQMLETSYCIDVNGSAFYNQIVDQKQVGIEATKGSTEAMRRDIHSNDHLYKKGLVIQHNPQNISTAGSCIFMHLWRGEGKPTAGCTAMQESHMDTLLAWINEKSKPLYVALPKHEYLAKKSAWGLPAIP
ncbi:hypothetical protein L0668_01675 [Paraglaciecola aquimarina]|uniref:YkuD domain-containing protein n=1 Tax=Paraglaciecola algarum TaxID=3050085 RepID=A0ABS9D2Z2_9ALTE|nr:hypothetical protein [Paraglaciecola sp. G1-23]MCF2946800.1 hypothetical protein [Paraglaciecola sp. G1-23]